MGSLILLGWVKRTQQLLPLPSRQPTGLPIRARILAAVVEEAVIVVGVLQREDGLVDEFVDAVDVRDEVRWVFEVHCHFAPLYLVYLPVDFFCAKALNVALIYENRGIMTVGYEWGALNSPSPDSTAASPHYSVWQPRSGARAASVSDHRPLGSFEVHAWYDRAASHGMLQEHALIYVQIIPAYG
jgi:hypothetical protein